MRIQISSLLLLLVCAAGSVNAKPKFQVHDQMMGHEDGHLMDMAGAMVMNQNIDKLPQSCSRVSGDMEITVHAGRKYAKDFPGTVYAFDQQVWHVKPCTRLTVHFINDDNIRHQWMMHGLPKYIYKSGMFHMEVTGPGKVSGTFILPANDQTYLVHCDMSQHMEHGLKAQLIVGKGGIPIPTVPGMTPAVFPDKYPTQEEMYPTVFADLEKKALAKANAPVVVAAKSNDQSFSGMMIIGILVGVFLAALLSQRYKGDTATEAMNDVMIQSGKLVALLKAGAAKLVALVKAQLEKRDA